MHVGDRDQPAPSPPRPKKLWFQHYLSPLPCPFTLPHRVVKGKIVFEQSWHALWRIGRLSIFALMPYLIIFPIGVSLDLFVLFGHRPYDVDIEFFVTKLVILSVSVAFTWFLCRGYLSIRGAVDIVTVDPASMLASLVRKKYGQTHLRLAKDIARVRIQPHRPKSRVPPPIRWGVFLLVGDHRFALALGQSKEDAEAYARALPPPLSNAATSSDEIVHGRVVPPRVFY